MPQTKPMIKGAQASDNDGLVSDQLRRHNLDGRTGEVFEPSNGGSP
jgi:hypothetical protein